LQDVLFHPFPTGSPLQPMVSDDITGHRGKWVTCIGKPEGLHKTGCTVYGLEDDGTCHTLLRMAFGMLWKTIFWLERAFVACDVRFCGCRGG
jgi:hypothetical protein